MSVAAETKARGEAGCGRRREWPGPGRPGTRAAVALLTALVPAAASAQQLAVELRAGASVGNYTETAAGLELLPAPSFAVVLETGLTGSLSGYAGFTRSTFGCEEGFCADRDVSLTSQGLILGGRWDGGLPWVRAGLAVQSLRLSAEAQAETSDPGVGWDLAAGVTLPVGRRLRLRPGLTYLRHEAATGQGDGHVAVLALEVGLVVGLGGD